MDLLDFLSELLDVFRHWRVYACIVPAALIGVSLHSKFPEAMWPWFISVPLFLGALVYGFVWQSRSEDS